MTFKNRFFGSNTRAPPSSTEFDMESDRTTLKLQFCVKNSSGKGGEQFLEQFQAPMLKYF